MIAPCILIDRIDSIANTADQLHWEIHKLKEELENGVPQDPPGWYEDCIDDLEKAEGMAGTLERRINAAWAEARQGE